MPVSEEEFQKLALEADARDVQLELHCGQIREKPGMSWEHNFLGDRLYRFLIQQLDDLQFHVRLNMGHVRRSSQSYYIPDLHVVPAEIVRAHRGERGLEVYQAPLPLVVEIWLPSTGAYDVESKLPEYQARGDLEVWRIHPYDRTLTTWHREADGSYAETVYTGGVLRPIALPGVEIDLDALFAES